MSDERRQQQRLPIPVTLEVFDASSGERLGRVVDLSLGGFMLLSEQPQTEGAHRCRITRIPPSVGLEELILGTECLWSRAGADDRHHWSGFHFDDLDEAQHLHLQALLECFSHTP
ncbi:PilZ domain-containing protein [Stutzerimonas nosocomialis]|uniref:PilZ domain-containing protein n=1 Tax=Stutzerimonas nosocomialis TaxID=1056496 RepID=A0A5R9QGW6_9GAMM|nr:PilZ domain-containing protein [Stutzerimonas nosocomialis]TLX55052.1 PilZ domain-containing protein [Stutzerimonas nosocomialis]TLX64290.1 PilZ domain-containing protein [Stutzerimonas nosocomialis]